MAITIEDVGLDVARERFTRPFGFKGGYFHEKWMCTATLTGDSGKCGVGIGGLAVLWSAPEVFAAHTEVGGNLIMATVLEHALQAARGVRFETPFDLLDAVVPEAHAFAGSIARAAGLTQTFTLNSLVALDNAAWVLYARERGGPGFDALVPAEFKAALSHRHQRVACVPAIGYGMAIAEIAQMVEDGCFFLKIKIGAPGDADEMLGKDVERLTLIHRAVGDRETPHTPDGRLRYYLDANGRYPDKATLLKLMDHIERIGMLEQVAVIEEPYPAGSHEDVWGVAAPVAADESLHDPADVEEKQQLGYGCLALKPAGKTLSVSMRMAAEAHQRGMACFVADSGCVPVLVDWNKTVAARLPPFPGFSFGLLESNGAHYYKNWSRLMAEHPCSGAPWLTPSQGVFLLTEDFYDRDGGIFG